MVHPPTQDDV
jgi:hypothetical protein